MPCTVLSTVLMLNDPLFLTATRPMYVPTFLTKTILPLPGVPDSATFCLYPEQIRSILKSSCFQGNVCLVNVMTGFGASSTGLTPYTCLTTCRRTWSRRAPQGTCFRSNVVLEALRLVNFGAFSSPSVFSRGVVDLFDLLFFYGSCCILRHMTITTNYF